MQTADTPIPYDPNDPDDGPYDPNDAEAVTAFWNEGQRLGLVTSSAPQVSEDGKRTS